MAADIDAAWLRFRGRLADALAALADGEVVLIEVETGIPEEELEGAAPYVQFLSWDDGAALRGEVASNHYLDDRRALTPESSAALVELGWAPATAEDRNFHVVGEPRDADRLADLAVRTLREIHGVPHPAFLDAEGLELDGPTGANVARPRPGMEPPDDEPLAVMVESVEELRELVDVALRPMLGVEIQHDQDGDVPIIEGSSVLYVHVDEERPEIRLFAILVHHVAHPDRLPVELDILNRTQRFARFTSHRGQVVLSHELCAVPFAPRQLRAVVADLLLRLDGLARDLAARVGGSTWLGDDEPAPAPTPEPTPEPAPQPTDPPLATLLELLHTGRVDTRSVAGLFDGDRLGIIRRIVAVRTGAVSVDGHEQGVVLDHLRRALRYVVDGDLPERSRTVRRVAPRRTQQLSLVDDGDLGQDTLEVE